jgi:hypothetical protein
MTYGFLGFSYPLEGGCSDDGYAGINSDFAAMKKDFGATLVRIYLPECYTTVIWQNVLHAAINNNMGVILQVAWPLNGDPVSISSQFRSLCVLYLHYKAKSLTSHIRTILGREHKLQSSVC